MPSTLLSDGDYGRIVFERPRRLGPGVEVFNSNDVPITPCGPFIQPDEYPSKLSIDETFFTDFHASGSMPFSNVSFISQGNSHTGSQTQYPDTSFAFINRRSFAFTQRTLQNQLRRILLIGPPGLICSHITAKLLERGHHVRLLERDYRGKDALRRLEKLVQTRPSRLTLFYEDDFSLAVADCDGVICVNGPDTSDLCEEEEIQHRFLVAIEDLFLSIRSYGKSVRRVILVSPASAIFPVETTLESKSRRLQRAQAASIREAERLSGRLGVPLTVLLPAMVVGPSLLGECDGNVQALVRFAQQTRAFTTPLFYNFVDVRDVAEACVVVLLSHTAEHQKYILSGGELSLREVGRALQRGIAGLTPPWLELPAPLTKLLAAVGLLEFCGFEACEWVGAGRAGWRYTLSSLKAQRDLALQLHPATDALVTAVARATNLPMRDPQTVMMVNNNNNNNNNNNRSNHLNHSNNSTTNSSSNNTYNITNNNNSAGGRSQRSWQQEFICLSLLCSIFGTVGYCGGRCFMRHWSLS